MPPSRKGLLASLMASHRAARATPLRHDRAAVFLLLLIASLIVLSHRLFDVVPDPAPGQVLENDVHAPRGFIYRDRLSAAEAIRTEFERQPAPYRFDTGPAVASSARIRGHLAPDQPETGPAAAPVRNAARRARTLRRVDELLERVQTVGLLDQTLPPGKVVRIAGRKSRPELVPAEQLLQPGDWDRVLVDLDAEEREAVTGILNRHLVPTLRFDEERATEIYSRIEASYPPETHHFSSERPMIAAGQELTERHVDQLRQLNSFMRRRAWLGIAALAGFLALTLVFAATYMRLYLGAIYDRIRDVSAIAFLFGLTVSLCFAVEFLVGRIDLGPFTLTNAILPLATGAMVLALLYDARVAFFFSLLSSILVAVTLAPRLVLLVMFLFGAMTASFTVTRARRRSDLFRAGLWVAFIQLLVIVLLGVIHGDPFSSMRADVVSAILSGFLSAAIAQVLLLPMELISRRVSAFTLLELTDLNHPILELLLRKAPGTFQHSQHVALLAQSAADVIGANALLTRVGAYFHDIGKMLKPEYFTENQRPGENPHDRLKSSLSAAVIRAHVLDGAAMAQEERIPEAVVNFINQHHGTSAMSVFYHRALEAAGEEEEIDRADFQYPGPNPQTAEVGLVMLADVVEAASRALPDPNANRIERLVKRLVMEVFESGQLDECDLTLRDLTRIADEFTRVLCSIHHTRRVDYPDQTEIEEAEKRRGE
jgi:hypothetical protein